MLAVEVLLRVNGQTWLYIGFQNWLDLLAVVAGAVVADIANHYIKGFVRDYLSAAQRRQRAVKQEETQ